LCAAEAPFGRSPTGPARGEIETGLRVASVQTEVAQLRRVVALGVVQVHIGELRLGRRRLLHLPLLSLLLLLPGRRRAPSEIVHRIRLFRRLSRLRSRLFLLFRLCGRFLLFLLPLLLLCILLGLFSLLPLLPLLSGTRPIVPVVAA